MKNMAAWIKIAAALAAAVIVVVIINSILPKITLFDYAKTLDEDVLACENAFVWRTESEYDGESLRVEKIGEAEVNKFAAYGAHTEPERMCAWEMACNFAYTFVGSDGSVWTSSDERESSDIVELAPFAIPAEEREDSGKFWLYSFSGSCMDFDTGYSISANCWLESERNDLGEVTACLAARFKDGWHYISSAEAGLSGVDAHAGSSVMYSTDVRFKRCRFVTAEYDDEFDIQFRVDIFDRNSGALLASKSLWAENKNRYISAYKQYIG